MNSGCDVDSGLIDAYADVDPDIRRRQLAAHRAGIETPHSVIMAAGPFVEEQLAARRKERDSE